MHDLVVRDLEQARNRTLGLTDLDDPTLVTQHDPLMSPLVWDLAHVGQQEELWLLRAGDPARPGMLPPAVDALYDAFKHPRAERPSLPLLPPGASWPPDPGTSRWSFRPASAMADLRPCHPRVDRQVPRWV
jgi:iron(II)-dependent oxidoreductase